MSQFNAGKASIDIVAENADLKQKLADSESALRKFEAAGEKSGGGFVRNMKDALRTIKDIAAALLALPAAAGAAFALGQKIRDLFNLNDTALLATIKKFETLDFKRSEEAIKTLRREMQDLQNAASAAEGLLIDQADAFIRGDSQGLSDRIAYVDGLLRTAEANRQHDQIEAERQAQAERYKAFRATADRIFADQRKQAEQEEELRREEYAAAVEDEMRHREWLKEQAEKAHQEELDRIAEREKATMDSLKKIADEMARIRREQESGFGLGNIIFAGTGNPARDAMLRARIGRGNGRF